MISLFIVVVRDYEANGAFTQSRFDKTTFVSPQRIDTATALDKNEVKAAVLPDEVKSVVRYITATGSIRLFYVKDEAAAIARTVGRALRGEDTNEPDFSVFQ